MEGLKIKNRVFLFDGFVLLLGCIILINIGESIFVYVVAIFSGLGALFLFFGDVAYIKFFSNSTVVKERFGEPREFLNSDILGVNISEEKIYLQTRHANFTIRKSWYNSEKYDRIANELLIIYRSYN